MASPKDSWLGLGDCLFYCYRANPYSRNLHRMVIKTNENFKAISFGKELRMVARRNSAGKVEMYLVQPVRSLTDIDKMFEEDESFERDDEEPLDEDPDLKDDPNAHLPPIADYGRGNDGQD